MVKSKHWEHVREVTADELRVLKPEGFPRAKERFCTASEKRCLHCGVRFWVPGNERESNGDMSKAPYGPKACRCSKVRSPTWRSLTYYNPTYYNPTSGTSGTPPVEPHLRNPSC